MSWDYVTDKGGNLEIIVSRWYSSTGEKRVSVIAGGFEPYEPVRVEVQGEAEFLAVKPEVK